MIRITPLNDIVIVKILPSETKSRGGIVIPGAAVEKSVRAEVLIPNTLSYHRNGELRQPLVSAGDIVVLQKGNIGTEMAESPDGETWLAIPEDCIYYIVRNDNENVAQ